jgi:hypothetical protein
VRRLQPEVDIPPEPGHRYARIIGPHRGLQLGGINTASFFDGQASTPQRCKRLVLHFVLRVKAGIRSNLGRTNWFRSRSRKRQRGNRASWRGRDITSGRSHRAWCFWTCSRPFQAKKKCWECHQKVLVARAILRRLGVTEAPGAPGAFHAFGRNAPHGGIFIQVLQFHLPPRSSVVRRNVRVTSFNASLVCCSPL